MRLPSRPAPGRRTPAGTAPVRPITGSDVIRSILRPNALRLYGTLPLVTFSSLTDVAVPVLIGVVVDTAIATGDVRALIGWIALLALVMYAGMWAWRFPFMLIMRAKHSQVHAKRVQVTRAVLDPASRPTPRSAGEVLSIATSDAERAGGIANMFEYFYPTMLALAFTVGAMFWLDWELGLANLAGVIVVLVLTRLISPVMVARHTAQQAATAEASATATDLVKGLRVLQGLGLQPAASRRYRSVSREALTASIANSTFSGLGYGSTMAIGGVMVAFVAALSGMFALEGRITPGQFIMVIGLARFMIEQLQAIGEYVVYRASVRASANRIAELLTELGADRSVLDTPAPVGADGAPESSAASASSTASASSPASGSAPGPEASSGPAPHPAATHGTGRAVVEDARLTVIGARHRSLRGVDLTARPGELTAVVCSTPAEARDLVDVIGGRLDATAGTVLIGETPLVAQAALRARETMLVEPHRADLFEGTLRDQLAARHGAVDDRDALAALRDAGAEDLLSLLDGGLDAEIQDRGSNLSGGQRQRIALARAFAAHMPVLVLHDPTTAVDSVTEQAIARGLVHARRRAGLVTLVVTHAPALLAVADRVLTVREGRVTGDSTHHDLSAHDARYAQEVLR